MTNQIEQLTKLFTSDPALAIQESQKIITQASGFNTYEDFYSYHMQHSHISTCQKEWSVPQMSICCLNCGIDPQSCICLECFLNGNHEGHEYIINTDSSGNCDCGDLSLWKKSGCCSQHQGVQEEHPENYLNENLRHTLTDIVFKSAFSSLEQLKTCNNNKVNTIIQFVSSFLRFGDGFRRLIAISLTEKIDFHHLIEQIFVCSLQFNTSLQQLCGGLINDQLFKVNFGNENFSLLLRESIPRILKCLKEGRDEDDEDFAPWTDFWFQSFSPQTMELVIEKFNWDWVTFSLEFSKYMLEFMNIKFDLETAPSFLFSEICNNMHHASNFQPNEQTQLFFDELFTKVLNVPKPITASFMEFHQEDYYYSVHMFSLIYYDILTCFNMNKTLKFDKLIEVLDQSIDISPIFCLWKNVGGEQNDSFVSSYINAIHDVSKIEVNKDSQRPVNILLHFNSFHNGGAFFYIYPLFDSLCFLMNLDNLCRIKISQLLKQAKFKRLRIQLGIVTLKRLMAFVCSHQSLIPKTNFSLLSMFTLLTRSPIFIENGIPRIFPLLQMLIGLEGEDDLMLDAFSMKEFYAFEMAREIGVFDDYTSSHYLDENVDELKKQMIFSFLYFSLLIVIERNLFNYDRYKINKELIISALKNGISSIDELNDIFDFESHNDYLAFNKILMEVVTVKSNNKNASFALKEGIKWNPISAINPINSQKVILNNEIRKNPNNLIRVQEFEDEKTYFYKDCEQSGLNIRLKEFLFTPTVLSIVYHTLRSSNENCDLNDHLALNILILINKFVNESNDESCQYDANKTIEYSSVHELISKLRNELFNYKQNEKGNSMITNTLNKNNFKAFLKIKFVYNNEAKSIIDILESKGELGQSVLNELPNDIRRNANQDAQMKKEINKRKASDLKNNILKRFNTIINNYNANNIDDAESAIVEDSEELCSICSSAKKDQILSYPLFIYKTKFPFIIDKPPYVDAVEGSEFGVDEDEGFDLQDDLSNYFDNEYSEEEEEEEEYSVEGEHETSQIRRIVSIVRRALRSHHSDQNQEENKEKKNDEKNKDDEKKEDDKKEPQIVKKRCTEGCNFVIQFSICQHPIHPECVQKKLFKCPIDRSSKNGFLPILDTLNVNDIYSASGFNENVKNSISCFTKCFTNYFNDKPAEFMFIELVKSISGLISTFEVRLRSLPGCLDSNKNRILSRNLFLTAFYSYRINGKPPIEHRARLTVFQRFILSLIENDKIEGPTKDDQEFRKVLNEFIEGNKNEDKPLFLLLRRVCLSEYFLLNHNIDIIGNQQKVMDWYEILSVTNITQRYEIQLLNLNKDFEMKPIVYSKFPKNFLHFKLEPFNFPVEKTQDIIIYNILDYNNLIKNFEEFDGENNEQKPTYIHVTQSNTLKKLFANKNYPIVLLMIGKFASQVFVLYSRSYVLVNSFYLDKFGCSDISFSRKKPLFLNEERYERTIDEILSGDFSHDIFRSSIQLSLFD